MKKILSLMLVLLCMVSMVACGDNGGTSSTPQQPSTPTTPEETEGNLDVFAASQSTAVPTKIVSLTTYAGKDLYGKNITFSGSFTQVTNGNNSILDYKYDRFATIDEAADDYIVTVEGAIAVKDGLTKTIGDGVGNNDWVVLIPSAQQMGAFKLDKTKLPSDYKLSTDSMKLTVSLSKAEALAVIGVVIDATGDISLTVESNGKNISAISIAYTAASGASVKISTSYTYGAQTLDFSRFN